MARTKRAAVVKARAAIRAELASNGELATAYPNQDGNQEAMDMSDDGMSDDGGVPLNMTDANNVTFADNTAFADATPGSSLAVHPPLLPPQAYMQDPSLFVVPGAQLWRFPTAKFKLGHAELTWLKESGNGPAFIYHKCMNVVQSSWGCGPAQALPEIFHESTPYSLALLMKLRVLSSSSKGGRLQMHALLHDQWLKRVSALGSTNPLDERSFTTTTVEYLGARSGGRLFDTGTHQIQENIFGIILEDVINASRAQKERAEHERRTIRSHQISALRAEKGTTKMLPEESKRLKRERKAARKSAMQARELEMLNGKIASGELEPGESKLGMPGDETKAAKRERRKAARQAEKAENTKSNIASGRSRPRRNVPSAAPQHLKPSAALGLDDVRAARKEDHFDNASNQYQQPSSSMSLVDIQYGQLGQQDKSYLDNVSNEYAQPSSSTAMEEEEGDYGPLSRRDRGIYNSMAVMIGSRVHVGEGPKLNRKQRNAYQTRLEGLSANTGEPGPTALPSERFDFSTMPGLHTTIGGAQEGEMVDAMSTLDLAKLGQQPLPSLLANRGTTISDQDNLFFRQ